VKTFFGTCRSFFYYLHGKYYTGLKYNIALKNILFMTAADGCITLGFLFFIN